MNTRKLPPTLVVALGLAGCADDEGGGGTTTVGGCLFAPYTESADGPGTLTDDGSSSVGPCLTAPQTETGTTTDGSTSGSSSSGSDGSSTAGTESGSSGTAGDSTGPAAEVPDHDAVIDRVLELGVLPADVAAKLQRR